MKLKLGIVLLFVAFFQLSLAQISAHQLGQPPFFKVNGKYADFHDVYFVSNFFEIPQDASPQNYLVGQNLEFEIDTIPLQLPEDVAAKSTFNWDFGDGQKGTGLKETHTYTKPGSYILKVDATYSGIAASTQLEANLVNILPEEDYQIPSVQIKVNGRASKDVLTDIFRINYDEPIEFEAEITNSPTGKIVRYIWDFGDSQTATGQNVTHAYQNNPERNQFFPILRVEDENGFFSDAYVQVTTQDGPISSSTQINPQKNIKVFTIGAVILVVSALAAAFILKRKSKKQ